MTARVFVEECTGYGAAGPRYQVTTETGRILIASSRIPAFDAARALLAEGTTGRLEVWRPGGTHPVILMDIERAAELTVVEGDRQGPRFGKWTPAPTTMGANADDEPDPQFAAGMAHAVHASRQGRRFGFHPAGERGQGRRPS